MSYLVIAEVTEFLRQTLWEGLQQDQLTRNLVPNPNEIVLANPGQPAPGGTVRKISLWLYQVMPNEHLRNAPFVRKQVGAGQGADDDVQFYPPLGVNLTYLLTPSIQSAGGNDGQIADQRLLGRAMQIFHDQSVLRMPSTQSPGQDEELHLSLAPRTIDELAEVWEAMQQPYRLSVCYEVRVARIESRRRLGAERVKERTTEFGPLVGV